MKKLLLVLMTCLFLFAPTMGKSATLTCDDQAGDLVWLYNVYLNELPPVVSPAVKGIDDSLIRLWYSVTGKVNLGVENAVSVTISDQYGQTSGHSEVYKFIPRVPVTPVAPRMIPSNGKRMLITTETTIDTENINGEVQYVLVLNGQTTSANAVKKTDTTQRCEIDISAIVKAGVNTGTLTAKNGWGTSANVPLSLDVSIPVAPSGLKFSVD